MKKILLCALLAAMPLSAFAWERSYVGLREKADYNKVTTVEILGWNSSLDGSLNVEGMNIDLDRDAGMGDENRFGLKISHVLSGKSSISLAYMSNDHSGNVNKVVTFDGKNYQAGASIDIENSWLDLTYSHNLTRGDAEEHRGNKLEAFYLDAMLGVKFSSAEVSVAGRENTLAAAYLQDSWSEDFPVPYLGLAAGGQLAKNVWLKGHLKYMNVNAGGNDALHADYGINLALKLNQNSTVDETEWFVDLGYRGVKYDVDSGNDSAELRYTGPTLGIVARF
jgi:hypothetical protein